nr:DUF4124 domain-containing protein [Thermomonas alba]
MEQQAAAEAAAIRAERANTLYRWRDADGILHVSDTPPKHHRYERIPKLPKADRASDESR